MLRWCEPSGVQALPASKLLERRIERAVACADVAWSYYDRLFLCGAEGESPFQFRSSRVDAAQRRFAVAAARLEREAAGWLSVSDSDLSIDDQSKLAIRRMQQWLSEHPVPARFPVGDEAGSMNVTIDMLENALANLRQRRMQGASADPFRQDSARVGQDVTSQRLDVSRRHVSTARQQDSHAPLR